VLDDITPLEQYEESVPQQEAHLFSSAAASHTVFDGSGFRAQGNVGKNPPAGVVVDYWLKTSLKKSDKKEAAGVADSKSKDGRSWPGRRRKEEEERRRSRLKFWIHPEKVIRKFPKKEEPAAEEESFFERDRSGENLPADAGLKRFVWICAMKERRRCRAHRCGGVARRVR